MWESESALATWTRTLATQLRQARGFSLHWLVTCESDFNLQSLDLMELLCSEHTDFTEVTHAILNSFGLQMHAYLRSPPNTA
jgi:hypothetical protein